MVTLDELLNVLDGAVPTAAEAATDTPQPIDELPIDASEFLEGRRPYPALLDRGFRAGKNTYIGLYGQGGNPEYIVAILSGDPIQTLDSIELDGAVRQRIDAERHRGGYRLRADIRRFLSRHSLNPEGEAHIVRVGDNYAVVAARVSPTTGSAPPTPPSPTPPTAPPVNLASILGNIDTQFDSIRGEIENLRNDYANFVTQVGGGTLADRDIIATYQDLRNRGLQLRRELEQTKLNLVGSIPASVGRPEREMIERYIGVKYRRLENELNQVLKNILNLDGIDRGRLSPEVREALQVYTRRDRAKVWGARILTGSAAFGTGMGIGGGIASAVAAYQSLPVVPYSLLGAKTLLTAFATGFGYTAALGFGIGLPAAVGIALAYYIGKKVGGYIKRGLKKLWRLVVGEYPTV